ncbi:MAG: hypothetical protein R2705_01565 [Ilumatobacteraceae bacterium]
MSVHTTRRDTRSHDADHPERHPCWYELTTSDLTSAREFYANVAGWAIADAGMEGFTYLLAAAADGGQVAGMSEMAGGDGPPPSWLVYFTADDVDAAAASVAADGGRSSTSRPTSRAPDGSRSAPTPRVRRSVC